MNGATRSLAVVSIVFAIITLQKSIAGGITYPKTQGAKKADAPASQPTSQPSATVRIDNFAYEPKELQIAVGTTVTWKNADDVPHTATSKDDPQTFDSGPLDTDDKFSFTFSKPGTYAYYCKVHPHMTGVITVK